VLVILTGGRFAASSGDAARTTRVGSELVMATESEVSLMK